MEPIILFEDACFIELHMDLASLRSFAFREIRMT